MHLAGLWVPALLSLALQVHADSATWNTVLSRSCPFEFNPAATTATAAEQDYIGMWVGHEYNPTILREGRFTSAQVTSFSNHPWAENVACGKMMKRSNLSPACQSLIRAVRCSWMSLLYEHWCSFSGFGSEKARLSRT